MSTCDQSLQEPLTPAFPVGQGEESEETRSVIRSLDLQSHPEGGYYKETDRDALTIPNPFKEKQSKAESDSTRSASTTIYYMVTPKSPQGYFHRNLGRTVHTLHFGRGRYIILHPQPGKKARIETFIVGHDIEKGEVLQWIVEGGKFKASFLLPDAGEANTSDGLLISETVVPGFEFTDHDFMTPQILTDWVSKEQADELSWLVKQDR